jgi:tetratricopeptide (TPR) repeat protein
MRLVQEAVAEGDVETATKYMKKIKFPNLLFKPIRSGYYMLQSNLSMATNDLASAESSIRKSLSIKSTIIGDMEGANLMQLGFIELRKGNSKEARTHLLAAVKAGIPDKDNLAAVYLQLCNMEAQRQQYKVAKMYFKDIVNITEMHKQLFNKMTGAQIKELSQSTIAYASSNLLPEINIDVIKQVKEMIIKSLKDVKQDASRESISNQQRIGYSKISEFKEL